MLLSYKIFMMWLSFRTWILDKGEKMESYSMEEVRQHNSVESAWFVNKGRVFDVTEFVSRHPGGRNVLLPKFGNDVTEIMQDPQIHKHTAFAHNMMKKYCIGKLDSQV